MKMTSLVRPPDEVANVVTHGFGLLMSVVAVRHLAIAVTGKPLPLILGCGVYSTCLLLVYSSSVLSHLFYDLQWRQRFRTWDQASIFLMIAGTFTPFVAVYLHQRCWHWLLGLMWIFACAGVFRVIQTGNLPRREKLSYGVLGILPGVALGEIARHGSSEVVLWIVMGGASYLVGVPFLYRSAATRYAHAIWHVLVMVGSACHYHAISLAIKS